MNTFSFQEEVTVTPLAGVWIEIAIKEKEITLDGVTPLAGVWIEIAEPIDCRKFLMSLPLRECGLKSIYLGDQKEDLGHSPCGSVD